MTRHRFIRCTADVLLDRAQRRHPGQHRDGSSTDPHDWVVSWFGSTSPRRRPAVVWRQQLAGNLDLGCCLEVEQGANGVLAHLSVKPTTDTTWRLAMLVSRLAVDAWVAHELSILARDAETVSRLHPADRAGGR